MEQSRSNTQQSILLRNNYSLVLENLRIILLFNKDKSDYYCFYDNLKSHFKMYELDLVVNLRFQMSKHENNKIILQNSIMSNQLPTLQSTPISKTTQIPEKQKPQFQQSRHMNSSILPKIHKTTAMTKSKNIINATTNIMLQESDEQQRRKKMAIIIHDYLENFRTKQRSPVLAVITPDSRSQERKTIKIQGISHQRFRGGDNFSSVEEVKKCHSLDLKSNLQILHPRLKNNRSFIQKFKYELKIDSVKYKSRTKLFTEPDRSSKLERGSHNSLKDYVLKAKKSLIDYRSLSKEQIDVSKSRGKRNVKK